MIVNSYSSSFVEGTMDVGGLFGGNDPNGVVNSCFNLDPNDSGGPVNGLATPVTRTELKQQSTFADWDFKNTWSLCSDQDYPRLQWEQCCGGE